MQKEAFTIHNNDVLCIASKLISKSAGLFVDLKSINPSQLALRLHQQIPRKDPRLIQIIIDQTSDKSGKKLQTSKNFIGGWLPNGLFLTSAGVDKIDAGISGLRKSQHEDKTNVETICDMLAASAGLLMGQKGKMLPIVKIHGIDYTFDKFATIRDAVN
nr:coenzyme F420-0:L-glutamate ligase [Lactobacillus sp. UMNPBX16]